MIQEFFCSEIQRVRVFAWVGLLFVVVNALADAWLSVAFTQFYREFYDLMQSADPVAAAACVAGIGNTTAGSTCADPAAQQSAVMQQLYTFGRLALAAAILHPVARFVQSHVAFAWRCELIRSYTRRWETTSDVIEGASQRIHEDTQRFAGGMELAASVLLDAALALAVFTPRLLEIGHEVPPPGYTDPGQHGGWLLLLAVALSVGGLLVSLVVAGRLVDLELENQRVEARFRKGLVLWESGAPPDSDTCADGVVFDWMQQTANVVCDLRTNYHRLFRHFFYFNTWVGVFEQAVVILPYVLVAPRLFDARRPVTLGLIVELARVFDKVFSALSVPMRNWAHVNNFRSTIRRLYEFERHTAAAPSQYTSTQLVAVTELASAAATHAPCTSCTV